MRVSSGTVSGWFGRAQVTKVDGGELRHGLFRIIKVYAHPTNARVSM
jgi:hypothetical protein